MINNGAKPLKSLRSSMTNMIQLQILKTNIALYGHCNRKVPLT